MVIHEFILLNKSYVNMGKIYMEQLPNKYTILYVEYFENSPWKPMWILKIMNTIFIYKSDIIYQMDNLSVILKMNKYLKCEIVFNMNFQNGLF